MIVIADVRNRTKHFFGSGTGFDEFWQDGVFKCEKNWPAEAADDAWQCPEILAYCEILEVLKQIPLPGDLSSKIPWHDRSRIQIETLQYLRGGHIEEHRDNADYFHHVIFIVYFNPSVLRFAFRENRIEFEGMRISLATFDVLVFVQSGAGSIHYLHGKLRADTRDPCLEVVVRFLNLDHPQVKPDQYPRAGRIGKQVGYN